MVYKSSEALCYNLWGVAASKFVTFLNGATVMKLWGGVWDDLAPIWKTETRKANTPPSYHKSHTGALSWRTCHDKMKDKGLFTFLNV